MPHLSFPTTAPTPTQHMLSLSMRSGDSIHPTRLTVVFNIADALGYARRAYGPDCMAYNALFWPVAATLYAGRPDFLLTEDRTAIFSHHIGPERGAHAPLIKRKPRAAA